jgi:hypothetical protein
MAEISPRIKHRRARTAVPRRYPRAGEESIRKGAMKMGSRKRINVLNEFIYKLRALGPEPSVKGRKAGYPNILILKKPLNT